MKRPYAGFSLIELMVALAIFGLLLMLAGPQYAKLMGDSQIRNAAEAMLNGVQQAQSRAIHSNTLARLQVNSATGWQVIETIEGVDGVVQIYSLADGAPKANVARTPADATQVTFDGFGRVVPNADASATLTCLKVTDPDFPSGARNLNVAITSNGIGVGTKLCDPNVAVTEPQGCPAGCT
jgi:type IV fimbrial biogenesis protein FimT